MRMYDAWLSPALPAALCCVLWFLSVRVPVNVYVYMRTYIVVVLFRFVVMRPSCPVLSYPLLFCPVVPFVLSSASCR
ncbi:hypothetical protein C2E23DRAFT_801652 [Lenzites betulinus]|nr:hypothetical protein C2E23DRAFT_801652 [Lenzites betulinus]